MAKNANHWEQEAQRTLRVVETMDYATSVFGNRGLAARWMHQPARGLNRRTPIELVLTDRDGCEAVLNYLGRIEYGVYC
ncbi:antitoxin Xre/MbcA/ParS toxin-binding domain-containing protein [Pseudomonas turukhanskensis]|uniref:Antitoxin Xre/MbcA/ParS-like toxin-binding domain-containing protein n=1 Tax=Pseudomonas turukhanskensis TaxID=1806536 RepID=A0A9W6NH51_9PSED|nr:antitoxin Xre/MbcA/ParS toxin-binding domain-containing protein [Pseudomonas turukhanskensis]GLK90763.1 hypothetical protein GCM10017655_38270 [Pseudomonas turukhanskensis]